MSHITFVFRVLFISNLTIYVHHKILTLSIELSQSQCTIRLANFIMQMRAIHYAVVQPIDGSWIYD